MDVGIHPARLSEHAVFSITEDNQGRLWIGTYGGGLRSFNRVEETFSSYVFNPNDPVSLSNDVITRLLTDRSGVVWIGTLAGGLNKIISFPRKFLTYKNDPAVSSNQNHNFIFSLEEAWKDTLWIGTREGIRRLDRKSGVYITCLEEEAKGLPDSLKRDIIRAIVKDADDFLWIGTYGSGLFRVDLKNWDYRRHNRLSTGQERISSNYINTIYLDKKGRIWAGTSDKGLNKIEFKGSDKSEPIVTFYQHDSSKSSSISDNNIRCVFEDRRGNIWVGTHSGGLNKLINPAQETGEETWLRYVHDPAEKSSISSNHILSIYVSRDGILWIGTSGGGLNKLNEGSGTFTFYMEEDGLANNTVYGILEDESGNLWLSTNDGLSKFNPSSGFFQNYDRTDGLQGGEFNEGAFYKSPGGEMFFGGINGINSFIPETEAPNKTIPPIVITDLWVTKNNVKTRPSMNLQGDKTQKQHLVLPAGFNEISIEFSAMDFTQPHKNLYAYKIEGKDPEWFFLGHKHNLKIENLAPGHYVLQIKGSNNDGLWNEEGTSLEIKVESSFVLPKGSFLILGALFIFLIFIVFRIKSKPRPSEKKAIESMKILEKYQLTKREIEILTLVIQGKSNKDIANILYISEGTVKNHVYNIYQKMGVKNRLQILNMIRH
jgi:DNA-binding CsgD family transcriptional regulator/streptogramin lyase